jgi:anti-sigma factor RsiW
MTAAQTQSQDDEDAMIAALSDYLDKTLPEAKRAEVEQKIKDDENWKRTHAEMLETRDASQISGLIKARLPPQAAPQDLTEKVTKEIHNRSAGRFFGRRTFGDRVPFGALLVVALITILVIGYFMWSSQTGSLKVDKPGSAKEHRPAQPAPLP